MNGKEIFKAEPTAERAISSQNARLVNQVLTQVVARGTGRAANVPGWQVAGKTGSTDNNTNAWFVGYTPTLVTAVWMGAPEADISMRNVNGVTVFGGTYPAQIVGSFYRKAFAGLPGVPFAAPETGEPGRVAVPRAPRGEADRRRARGGSEGADPATDHAAVRPLPPAMARRRPLPAHRRWEAGAGERPVDTLPPEIQELIDRARNRNRPATNGSG